MTEPNFDPFIDWEGITPEMVDDIHATLKEFRAAQESFLRTASSEDAAAMLRNQWDLTRTIEAITQTLYTIPVMVHVAGEKKIEEDEQWGEITRQRCVKCGSVLGEWMERMMILTPVGPKQVEEEDLPWWTPGQRVAKAGTQGEDDQSMRLYLVEDRELDKHEMPCVDLQDLFGQLGK